MLKDPIFFLRSIIRHFLLVLIFLYGITAIILLASMSNLILNLFGNYDITKSIFIFSAVLSFGIGFFTGERKSGITNRGAIFIQHQSLIIGIFGFLFLVGLPLISEISKLIFINFENKIALRFFLNALIIFITLFLPTGIIGRLAATINKILSNPSSQHLISLGKTVTIFSAGGAVGGVIVGFAFFQIFGIKQSIAVISVVYILIALLIRLLFKNFDFKVINEKERLISEQQLILFAEPKEQASPLLNYFSIISFGLICFLFANFLVLFIRLNYFILGADVYVPAILLIALLVGFSCGSLIAFQILQRKKISIFPVFAILPVLLGALSLILFFLLPQIQKLNMTIFSNFQSSHFWTAKLFVYLFNNFILFVIPASLIGVAFIFINKILVDLLEIRNTNSGISFLLLTSGIAVGLIMTSSLFISQFGIHKNYIFLILIYFVIGLSIIFIYSIQYKKIKRTSLIFFFVLVLLLMAFFLPSDNIVQLYEHQQSGTKLLYAYENTHNTITINKNINSKQLILSANSDVISKFPLTDYIVEELSGIISVLLYPGKTESALVLGSGNGEVLKKLIQQNVTSIHCIEDSPEIISDRILLNDTVKKVARDSSIKYIFSDIYKYVKYSPKKYPLIISACYHPACSDNSKLFSKEFFASCKRILLPQGIFFMPLPIYGISIEDFKISLKTFQTVFPSLSIFYNNNELNSYVLLAGFNSETVEFDFERIYYQISEKAIWQDPNFSRFTNIYDLLDCFIMGTEEINKLTTGVRINTINKPILKYSTAKVFDNARTTSQILYLFKSYRESVYPYLTNFNPNIEQRDAIKFILDSYYNSSNYVLSAFVAQLLGKEDGVLSLFKQAYLINRKNYTAKKFLDDYYDPYLNKSPVSAFTLTENAKIYFQKTDYEQSISLLLRAVEIDKDFSPAYFALGLNYEALGDLENAEEMYKKTLKLQPDLQNVKDRLTAISSKLND